MSKDQMCRYSIRFWLIFLTQIVQRRLISICFQEASLHEIWRKLFKGMFKAGSFTDQCTETAAFREQVPLNLTQSILFKVILI